MFLRLFILREKVPVHKWGRGREREGESIPSRLHTVSAEPDAGLDPTNQTMRSRPEPKSRVKHLMN